MEAFTTQDGLSAGIQQLPPKSQCWEPSAGCPATPARASPPQPGAPPAPSAPCCHGNQHPPADRAAGMVPFLFLLFRAHFCFHFLGSQPPLPTQSSGQGHLFGMKWRLRTPRALRCHHVPVASPPGVSQQAPPCALNSSRELDLFPHGRKKSVCLRVAQLVLGVSLSAPRPDGYPL